MEEEIMNIPEGVEEVVEDTAENEQFPFPEEAPANEPAPIFEEVDYEALAARDLEELQALSSDFANVEHLSELPFARRFAELRELGLSVKEALYATLPTLPHASTKAHLTSSVPRTKGRSEGALSTEEMRAAKDLFYGLSEKEINSLYRRVSTR